MKRKTKTVPDKKKKITVGKKSSLPKKGMKSSGKSSLLELEANFKTLMDKTGIGISILSSEGRFLYVNSAFAKILGYTKKEFLKLTIQQITHPDDFETSHRLLQEVISGKRNSYQLEKRYISKRGIIKHAKLAVSRIDNKKISSKNIMAFIEDVTAQVLIAEKLEVERSLFHTLLEYVQDKIYFKDLNSRFMKVNRACAVKHGFATPELIIGKTDADTFGQEHTRDAYLDEQTIIKTGIPIIAKEEKEDWPDGRITWASTSKMPLFDSNGQICGIFGLTRDITESKLVQEKIKESERLYRSLFEGSDEGIFLTSDEVIIDCNQTVLDIFRCDREYIIGRSPAEFSPEFQPDGQDSLSSANDKINMAFNGSPQRFYWQHKRPDGTLVDCEISLKCITIEGHKVLQATMRDITQKVKSEAIREALFQISEAAYTASDMTTLYKKIHEVVGTLMIAKNFYIALYDEKAGMISFPYMIDEYDPPYPPKKLGKGLTEYVLRKGKSILIDAQIDLELRRTGEVEMVGTPTSIWLGVPLKVGGKTIGVIVVQDYENEKAYGEEEMQVLNFVSEQIAQVIERKRNSDAVKAYAEELKQNNMTKDKFFSIIAHDLKNPFITILGFTDLLISDFSEFTDEEKIYYLAEMRKSADASHNLLQNLLHWSRAQTGRIEFNPQNIDLNKVVTSIVDLLKPSAERKDIEILTYIPQNTFVSADEDMLNTIIRNLLTNSLKFTSKNGKIGISCEQLESEIQVCISDTGVGMNDQVKSNLFKLDVSQSTQGTNNETGTGLGLILCKEFVENNGGTIFVESEVGKGSNFYFTLPKIM